MGSLGLLFKYERTGFSVLYDVNRKEGLFEYLRRQGRLGRLGGQDNGQVWTRVSFVLSLDDAYFVNFTDIPIWIDPVRENFYFTNQRAHHHKGLVLLNSGRRVSGSELLSVVPVEVAVRVGRQVRSVRVRAISGEEVICRPRCVPADVARNVNPASITCKEAMNCTQDETGCKCASVLYLDFSPLPEDKYTIEKDGYDGQPAGDPEEVVYTAAHPVPLCFADLLFTDPTATTFDAGPQADERGIYPVVDLWNQTETKVRPVHYTLEFGARSTHWNYYIVPQPEREKLEGLSIENLSLRPVNFLGPCCVRMANGAKAYRFMTSEPLPLMQQSAFKFRLRGRRRGMVHEGILIERLPVASNRQVLPETDKAACEQLASSLCQGVDPSPACCELIRRICNLDCKNAGFNESLERIRSLKAEYKGEAPPRRRLPTNNYSDIYVYL
jgi:hypothetical protein